MLHLFPVMGSEVRGDVMFQPGDSLLDSGQRARRRSAQRLKLSVRRAIRRVAGWQAPVPNRLLDFGPTRPDLWTASESSPVSVYAGVP